MVEKVGDTACAQCNKHQQTSSTTSYLRVNYNSLAFVQAEIKFLHFFSFDLGLLDDHLLYHLENQNKT